MPKKTRAALEAEAVDAEPADEEFVPLPTSIEEEEKTEKLRKAEEERNSAVKFDEEADREFIEGESRTIPVSSSLPARLFPHPKPFPSHLLYLFPLPLFLLLVDPRPVLTLPPRPFADSKRRQLKAKGIKVPSLAQVERRKVELASEPKVEKKGPPAKVAAKGGKKA